MSDIDIEKLQADFENAITQQKNAEALYQEAKKEQDHNRKLLDSQIKSGIQAQFLKEESALNDVSKKADMNGRRITNLSHDVAKMSDEVKELRNELQKTATLDTLYSEREKELIRYYEQLKKQKSGILVKCDSSSGISSDSPPSSPPSPPPSPPPLALITVTVHVAVLPPS